MIPLSPTFTGRMNRNPRNRLGFSRTGGVFVFKTMEFSQEQIRNNKPKLKTDNEITDKRSH